MWNIFAVILLTVVSVSKMQEGQQV